MKDYSTLEAHLREQRERCEISDEALEQQLKELDQERAEQAERELLLANEKEPVLPKKPRSFSKEFRISFGNHLKKITSRFEKGEVSVATLKATQKAFAYIQEGSADKKLTTKEKYPDADREQWLFEYLCELVGINKQDHGPGQIQPTIRRFARKQASLVIGAMIPTWDKGDMYYPNPRDADGRERLVEDLLNNENKRMYKRARARNLSDMKHGRPFRGQGALMMEPPPRKPKKPLK
ncbi:hypothetical protein LJC07_02650 [Christensenellaceae bacterium OttesenSCG-928-L17]|nr:hypothetical protein [Christensenellaceae bacterium OttesenSCG-928-L17]